MAYKALYRTYRPQNFAEVIGQEHIVKTLQNSLASGKISHAYLFSGPRGTGKTSVARIFAKALNCDTAPTNEPCGKCTSCLEIANSNSPDVVEIDAASNNGVDEIREIRDKVKFLPGGAKYKIYIIDEVHMLSQGAFNALLKTLEEPPRHVIFILATTEPHKVLPTIISRCQRFDFKTLTVREISSVIKSVALNEGFKISDEAIIAIAEGAEGGMRDALSYLDQAASFTDDQITIDDVNNVTGNLNYDKIIELAHYFEDKNINKALKTISDLIIMGKEVNKIISSMLQFYRDALLYKNIDTTMFSKYIFEKEEFKQLVANIEDEKIFYYVDVLNEVQIKIKSANTPNVYLDVAVIKMIKSSETDHDYLARIQKLEEKLQNYSSDGFDNEKINSLEGKLARVVSELSRLELHKLIERVRLLEETKSTNIDNIASSELQTQVNTLENALKNLQEQIQEIKNHGDHQVDNLFQNQNLDELKKHFDERFLLIKQTIISLQEQVTIIRENYQSGVEATGLDEIKLEINELYQHKLNLIERELEDFKNKYQVISVNQNDNDLVYDVNIIKDKLTNIEAKVYKLMSGALANATNNPPKKSKSKANKGQIVLFGDEIMAIDDFDKQIKEKYDFDELQKEKEETEDLPETIENDQKEEQLDNYLQEESTEESAEEESAEEELLVEEIELEEEKPVIEKENKIVKIINTEEEEIIESKHSQLVRRLNPEKENASPISSNSLKSESTPSNVDKKDEKANSNITTRKYVLPNEMSNDQYSNYDVVILERILHSSRSEAARNDKKRIANLWRGLSKSTPRDQLHIADLLQEGQLVAVGEKEFVLVYSNAALCNQVMKMAFKRDSLKLLYDFLGDTYNYLALPEYVWNDKRTEYINQYNIGIRFPKLTPINDPNLNVITENQEYLDNQESSVNKALNFFGQDLVKIE